MRGMLLKIYWETRWPTVLFAVGLAAIMALLTALLPKVLGDIHLVFQKLPFVKPLITALLGVDPGRQLTASMSQAFLWVHPTVLTLIWAQEAMFCSRLPAGEIDRGTIDFLLGQPISRIKLFLTESLMWMVSGCLMIGCGLIGHWLSADAFAEAMSPPFVVTLFVIGNLLAVYWVVGSLALLVSSISDRRNRALGVIFAVLLFSFLINFVAQFWDPFRPNATPMQVFAGATSGVTVPAIQSNETQAESDSNSGLSLASLSVMNYYRPAMIIQTGKFPTINVMILLGLGLCLWSSAAIINSRRSICTV